ncbi:MFS transporter [Rhizobium sp. 2MFCol3.1]|uniref:MFS transporter n=1 Tax=Rhizobium sp. 2MFCol3.1 TaxID=1246459 RepID=UPI0003A2735E|nr:MFS transporter [Rhizobium sp. 2MFCol3.1]
MRTKTTHSDADRSSRRLLLLLGVFLIAMNLRAPFTGVAPLLDMLKDTFDLNAAQAGLLITLPLLAFSIVSPFAAGLAGRFGLERTLMMSLIVIAGGIFVRSSGSGLGLYIGTAIIGGGIAIGNVLLPSILKRDFPDRVASLTAAYVLVMGCTAAALSTLAVPFAQMENSDWRLALAASVLLPILAALAWLPQLRSNGTTVMSNKKAAVQGRIWHSPLAWQVTLFLGLDCFLYYVGVSWLPAILRDASFTEAQAGSMHGVLLLSTALPGLVLIPLAPRMKDQRHAACLLALSIMIGLMGLHILPSLAVLWIVFFGFGAGGGLILALSFVSLRTVNASDAAALSGMSQCIGYLLAATGPTLVGSIHDVSGGWGTPLIVCAALSIAMAVVGLLAGRNVQVTLEVTSRPGSAR